MKRKPGVRLSVVWAIFLLFGLTACLNAGITRPEDPPEDGPPSDPVQPDALVPGDLPPFTTE